MSSQQGSAERGPGNAGEENLRSSLIPGHSEAACWVSALENPSATVPTCSNHEKTPRRRTDRAGTRRGWPGDSCLQSTNPQSEENCWKHRFPRTMTPRWHRWERPRGFVWTVSWVALSSSSPGRKAGSIKAAGLALGCTEMRWQNLQETDTWRQLWISKS